MYQGERLKLLWTCFYLWSQDDGSQLLSHLKMSLVDHQAGLAKEVFILLGHTKTWRFNLKHEIREKFSLVELYDFHAHILYGESMGCFVFTSSLETWSS